MKKSQLTELVKKIVREVKTIKEEDFNGAMTPQEKIARKKLEQSKIELSRANMQASQKNLANIR